jgi:hypothetical protein
MSSWLDSHCLLRLFLSYLRFFWCSFSHLWLVCFTLHLLSYFRIIGHPLFFVVIGFKSLRLFFYAFTDVWLLFYAFTHVWLLCHAFAHVWFFFYAFAHVWLLCHAFAHVWLFRLFAHHQPLFSVVIGFNSRLWLWRSRYQPAPSLDWRLFDF